MKCSARVLIKMLVAMAIMVAFTVPVFAQEVTNPNEVIKKETFNAGMEKLENEFHSMEVDQSNNYIKYLDGVIYNLNETARIKQEVVTNYKELAKVNPYYATFIPKAEYDLVEAKSWVDYYKLYKGVTTEEFKVRYNW